MDFLVKRPTLATPALTLLGCLLFATLALATPSVVAAAPPVLKGAAIGFDGGYKLGLWTELSLTFEADGAFDGRLGVEVPDGDGVPVEQLSSLSLAAGTQTVRVPVRLGRPRGNVTVRLYPLRKLDLDLDLGRDRRQDAVSETTLALVDAASLRRKPSPFALPAPRPAEQRLMVAFGAETGLAEALRLLRSRGRTDGDRVFVQIDSLARLPRSRWGLDAADTVVIAGGDDLDASQVAPEQWQALVEWTELGGRVVVVGGASSEALLGEGAPLAALAPGRFDRLERLSRLRGLETLAAVDEPLAAVDAAGAPLTVATAFFRDVEGTVISFEGAAPAAGATIVRYPVRFGEATYVAFDLTRAPFAGWVGREGLWREILTRGRRAKTESDPGQIAGRAVHLGYDDLSGQVRTTLERFEGVRMPSFLAIVFVLIVYLAWIGPGDWFFLKRVVGRMEWTWATFAVSLALIGFGIWLAADYLRGDASKWNQLDIVDIAYDEEGRALVRGYSWSVAYSDSGRKYDLEADARPFAPSPSDDGTSVPSVLFSWEGLPGAGVGAMSSAGNTALTLPPYELIRKGQEESLRNVPIPVSSTKAFVGRWSERFQAPVPARLFRSPINDLLRGEVTNPLPVTLEEARIISGSWIYTLDDLEPGETWSLSELDSPMNLEWRLKRRRSTADNRDETETWDPTHASFERLVEMLMFHQAAGGRDYSADLGHEYYPQLDLSDRLEYPGAMLVGRIVQPALTVTAEPDVFDAADRRVETWVRIVLPVAPAESPRRVRDRPPAEVTVADVEQEPAQPTAAADSDAAEEPAADTDAAATNAAEEAQP
ncbi:MAG TPA: hypothetical protein VGN57_20990 [Pirellulaceae bacterium]|jgi:hypothetical protein|nr:hypothetical protein [Pirellulaceae bacterium]